MIKYDIRYMLKFIKKKQAETIVSSQKGRNANDKKQKITG